MSLNLRHLKYFVATAELGQVSRAAIELSISQSAVTAAIRDLEDTLGTPLFQRVSHGMILTEAGRRFLAQAYEILEKVDEALRTQDAVQLTGRLRIAATYTVIGYFLPMHLERIARLMPGVELQLHEMSRSALEDALVARRVDVGVALTGNITNPDIARETLLRSPRRLWLPARHPLLDRGSIGFAEVAREPYVMLTVDEAAHSAMRYWSRTSYSPRVLLRTSSIEAVRSIVANGQGVSILSDMVFRPWSLEGRRLETRELDTEIPSMDVGLVWSRDVQVTEPMTAFRDYFRNLFGAPQSAMPRLN